MLDLYKKQFKRKKPAFRGNKCRTKAGWEQRRKEVHDRENGLCELCLGEAPLHNTERAYAGHAHHIEGRKRGDDRAEMLMWLCGRCHSSLHIPSKVLPSKRHLGETA